MVPQAGLEPALLSEPHFECGASTNFTTGAKPWTAGGMIITTRTVAAAMLLLALAVIGFVQFAEHVQFYEPCELCLRERLPWYLLIGLGLIGLVFQSRWILGLIGLAFLVS